MKHLFTLSLVFSIAFLPRFARAAEKEPPKAGSPAKEAGVMTPPVVRSQGKPVYPKELEDKGITGVVKVVFVIDSTGNVRNAWAVESTDPLFSAAAIKCVEQWKFKPALVDGKPVETQMSVDLYFKAIETPAKKK